MLAPWGDASLSCARAWVAPRQQAATNAHFERSNVLDLKVDDISFLPFLKLGYKSVWVFLAGTRRKRIRRRDRTGWQSRLWNRPQQLFQSTS
jgi:hypothetical protein